jgi:hypothetical protein
MHPSSIENMFYNSFKKLEVDIKILDPNKHLNKLIHNKFFIKIFNNIYFYYYNRVILKYLNFNNNEKNTNDIVFFFKGESLNKSFLFNGASEFKMDAYYDYLEGLGYKSEDIKNIVNQIYIIKTKRALLFFDVGSPPPKKYSSGYQSGPLSFEYFVDNKKIITNCGFGNKISQKAELISRLTSAQSTLCLNDSSVVKFEKNTLIQNTFGTTITSSFKVFDIVNSEDTNFVYASATHDAYKYNFSYLHKRSVKIMKKNSDLYGQDELISINNEKQLSNIYAIRFHLYPGVSAVQTMGKNSILVQIEKNKSMIFTTNGENLALEKSLFLGRNQIVNNFCITISGTLNINENKTINWELKKITRHEAKN